MLELPTVQELPAKLSEDEIRDLSAEVRDLAEERDAVILAHNYQLAEVQDVADFTGDSLGLSRQAAAVDAEVIEFCGVHFMAETASILCPDKSVLIPDLDAGCSLSDSIDADQLRDWKAEHPGARGRDVRQHLGRGQGRDRLLLHLLERRQGRRAHLGRARPRDRDPVRPRHVARRVRRARDRPDRGSRSAASRFHVWDGECHVHAGIRPEDITRRAPRTPRPSS